MWKTHFTVDSKGIVFHNPCGNHCGKLSSPVEIMSSDKVFHISTGTFLAYPVEMWKTRSQIVITKRLNRKAYCGKLLRLNLANYLQRLSIRSLTTLWKF